MIKKSLINISFVSIGNLFNAGLGFLFLTVVARSLSIENFGKYALLTTLLVSLARIMDFGTNSLYVAQAITKVQKIRNTFISTKFALFTIALLISLPILYALGLLTPYIMIAFILGLIAYGINFTLFGLYQKIQKFNILILLNTVPALIKGSFAGLVFFKIIHLDLNLAFSIFSLSIFSSSIFYFLLEDKKVELFFSKETKDLIINSAPAGTSQLINEGWPALSNGIAKISGDFANVGIFSLANKISQIFTLISLSIFTVLLPKNASRKKNKLRYDLTETLLLAMGVLSMAIVTILISESFITHAFGTKFVNSIKLLDLLIFASAITAIHTFMENYFFVEEKIKTILFITLSKITTFLFLCLILVPTFALQGLALAQLISAILALGITTVLIWKI